MSDKHAQARNLAEAALQEQAAGNDAKADTMLDEAMRIDPDAVDAVLEETGADTAADSRDADTDRSTVG